MAESRNCAHGGCGCEVEAGQEYCSEHCADAAARSSEACDCGHSTCG